RLIINPNHRPPRKLRLRRLDLIARRRRSWLQVQHGDTVDDRKHTAVASENAVENAVGAAAVKERFHELQAPAAVGTAKDLKQLELHGVDSDDRSSPAPVLRQPARIPGQGCRRW